MESIQPPAAPNPQPATAVTPGHLPSSGTVVLDVEQGGIVVPSFAGKSVRGAIELAEDSGLGPGRSRQRAGPGTVPRSGIACCDRIAGDGEIRALNIRSRNPDASSGVGRRMLASTLKTLNWSKLTIEFQ